MFEEKLIIRSDAQEARNRTAPSIHQIAICCFGKSQALSLVAISQTLNKLVIRDLSGDIELVQLNNRLIFRRAKNALNYATNNEFPGDEHVAYVSTRDVISSLSVHKLELEPSNESLRLIRDLLFIGCSSSIIVYDTYEQTNLFNIHTVCRITSLLSPEASGNEMAPPVIMAGGVQKLYSLQIERLNPLLPTSNLDRLLDIEINSERSTIDMVSCLCHGRCGSTDLVVTGSVERKIRVYSLDNLDRNIQSCRLTLNESSEVNCLCGIATVQSNNEAKRDNQPREQTARYSLPVIREQQHVDGESETLAGSGKGSQINYFAYGLENGFIGVYRLISSSSGAEDSNDGQGRLFAERLWRHKSRQAPVSVVLYDVDGDGLEELVFGYANGRLEARLPFTGQLVAKTRCFKSDELVSLVVVKSVDFQERVPASIMSYQNVEQTQEKPDGSHQTMLLACSVSISFVAFWLDKSRPPKLMLDYLGARFSERGAIQRPSVQSIDEMDESENWTNSLIDLSSLGTEEAHSEQLGQTSERSPQKDPFGTQPSDESHDTWQGLESPTDNLKPIQCQGKQDGEMLARLGSLHNDHAQLSQSVSKFYFERGQQMSSFDLDSGINLTYRWDLDAANEKLRLSVLLSSLSGSIELFELADGKGDLIKSGHFLMNPCDKLANSKQASAISVDTKTNLVVVPIEPCYQESGTRLRLRLYCSQLGSRDMSSSQLMNTFHRNHFLSKQSSQPLAMLRVYEKSIVIPKFSTLVPQTQDVATSDDILSMSFKLEESTSYLQILSWMRDNFLCFQFGQLHYEDREPIWPVVDPTDLIGVETEHSISPVNEEQFTAAADRKRNRSASSPIRWDQYAPFDRAENWSSGRLGPNGEMELELKLRGLRPMRGKSETGAGTRLRIACSLARVLTIECEDIDVMVDIIESLVIDCLKLNVQTNSVSSKATASPKLDPIDKQLKLIGEKTRQLEESEQRIQTELYESDDMIKNLMQQFAIANQLNEFKNAKELLNEISMMLDGAQNSAQAYQLNNQQRLKMSKKANHLREKMSFLLMCK